MIIYSITLILVGIAFLILGILLLRGNTHLIHYYHQENLDEEDRVILAKKIAKPMLFTSFILLLNGIISIIVKTDQIVLYSSIFVTIGLMISVIVMCIVIHNSKV